MTSGIGIMMLGGVLILSGQIYLGVMLHQFGLAAVIGFFGLIIIGIGYALWNWENKWKGRRSSSDEEHRAYPSDRSLAIIPPPRHLKSFDPDTGRRLCSFFFYDVDHRLYCLSGCEYPDAKHGACTRELTIPTCPYPISRDPVVKTLMPKPVAWCPGPGGCKHFNEQEYVCGLKLKGRPGEVFYAYERKSQNRRIGALIMVIASLPIFLQLLSVAVDVGFEVSPAMPIVGVFIGAIGAVVYSHAK